MNRDAPAKVSSATEETEEEELLEIVRNCIKAGDEGSTEFNLSMYPRVKAAREKEDPKTEFLLRLVDSLSEQGHSFSRTPPSYGRYSENHAPTADAKCLGSLSKNSPIAYACASKEKHSKKNGEDIRTNFRATFVSRPRAVLSSPENDELIGHQNRLMEERDALSKKQSMSHQQHIHGRDQPSHKAARVAENSTE